MNRGGFPSKSIPGCQVRFYIAVVGAGAAAPTVPTAAQYKLQTNAVSRVATEIPTRSGAGQYVIFAGPDFAVPEIAQVLGEVRGTTAGLWCKVMSFSVSARTYTVQIRNEAGTLTDLADGVDLLVLSVDGVDSVSTI